VPGRKKISVSRTGGILAQNIFAAWKTSRRNFFAKTGFERELFVLSSSELITATRVVHRIIARSRIAGKTRGARSSACARSAGECNAKSSSQFSAGQVAAERALIYTCLFGNQNHESRAQAREIFVVEGRGKILNWPSTSLRAPREENVGGVRRGDKSFERPRLPREIHVSEEECASVRWFARSDLCHLYSWFA
jgi:hypothetical protein